MNCLYFLIISFLSVIDDSNSDSSNTIVIFRKSKPSIIVFPNKQTITLNYPKQHRLTKLKLDGPQPFINFEDLGVLSQKQPKQQEVKPTGTKIGDKTDKVEKQVPKEIESPKNKQVPAITKPVENKYPLLTGNFRLVNPELFNLNKAKLISIKDNYITYSICSQNTCGFTQLKGRIEVGSCTLVSQPQCSAFSDLFYSDLRLLAQIKLMQRLEYSKGIYKFYDKYEQLRLELVKAN